MSIVVKTPSSLSSSSALESSLLAAVFAFCKRAFTFGDPGDDTGTRVGEALGDGSGSARAGALRERVGTGAGAGADFSMGTVTWAALGSAMVEPRAALGSAEVELRVTVFVPFLLVDIVFVVGCGYCCWSCWFVAGGGV